MGEIITSEEIKDKDKMLDYLYTIICEYVEDYEVRKHLTNCSKNVASVHFMLENNFLNFTTFSSGDNKIKVSINFGNQKEKEKYIIKFDTTSWIIINASQNDEWKYLTRSQIDNLFDEFLSGIKS